MLALCACSADVDYKVYVSRSERFDRPPPEDTFSVLIDGVARDVAAFRYESTEEAASSTVEIQLRYENDVIAIYSTRIGRIECGDEPLLGTIEVGDSYCQKDNGELRFGSRRIEGTSESCIGDGFCLPLCSVLSESGSCGDERCTSRILHFDPVFSRLDCAPAGPKQLGEPCAYVDDADGAYDDCGRGLLCVEGACRAVCSDNDCVYVAGHASELRVRL